MLFFVLDCLVVNILNESGELKICSGLFLCFAFVMEFDTQSVLKGMCFLESMQVLAPYFTPDIVIGAGDRTINKTKCVFPACMDYILVCDVEKADTKQGNKCTVYFFLI